MGTYDDGRPFYAMRFIRGDSLKTALEVFHQTDWSQRHAGERALSLRGLLGRFIDVCNAIAYAHSRGILHRDLKPGNIMLGSYGETLVVDWGLAKSQNPLHASDAVQETPLRPSGGDINQTLPGKAVGTPGYMSPEQAAGRMHDLGPKTDVYSLGATLYHVLIGRSPFNGEDLGEILQRVQRGDFLPPHSVDATISRPLDAICLKAMALNAADRYASPKELADDVERWLADEPVTAYAEPLVGRISRVVRRHKGVVRASAIALAAVAVIATLAAIRENSLNTALTETIAQRDVALKSARAATSEAVSSVEFLKDLFTTTDPLGMDAVDLDGRYYLSGSDLTPLQLVNEADDQLKSLQLSPQSRAVLLETIGNAYRGLGQYDRADPLLTEAHHLRTQVLPADSQDLALSRFNLANLRQDQGRFSEAEAHYRTAIAVLETRAADLKTLANMQFSLAWTLSQRYGEGRDERFAEAIAIMQRVIATRTQIYTRRSKEVAMTLATLSVIYRVAGRADEELASLGQATEIMKELGGDVVATIFVDYITAQGLRKLNLQRQSLAYYQRAYDATVKLAGKEHPAAIFLLADLAGFYNELGENQTALRLASEAVEVLDRSPLRWSPLAVQGMLDYARWLQESGDTLRVHEVLKHALLIAQTIEHAPLIEKCIQRINELPEPFRM